MTIFEKIVFFALGVMLFFVVLGLTLILRADAACLERGYPEARLDFRGRAYCVTLDGATEARVVSLDD